MPVIKTAKYMASIAEAEREDRKERTNKAFEKLKSYLLNIIERKAKSGLISFVQTIMSNDYILSSNEMMDVLERIKYTLCSKGYEIKITQGKRDVSKFLVEISWDTIQMPKYEN